MEVKIFCFLVADSGLFGVPLTTLLEQDQRKVPGARIPLIFKKVSKPEQVRIYRTYLSEE
jgi:hypothetical protein